MKQYVNPNCEIGHVSAAGGTWVDVDAEGAYGEMRTVCPQPGMCRLDDPRGGCGQICFERSKFCLPSGMLLLVTLNDAAARAALEIVPGRSSRMVYSLM